MEIGLIVASSTPRPYFWYIEDLINKFNHRQCVSLFIPSLTRLIRETKELKHSENAGRVVQLIKDNGLGSPTSKTFQSVLRTQNDELC